MKKYDVSTTENCNKISKRGVRWGNVSTSIFEDLKTLRLKLDLIDKSYT